MPDDAPIAIANGSRRRLEAIKRALVEEMRGLLRQMQAPAGGTVAREDALRNAARIRSQVLSLMREDGLHVAIDIAEQSIVDAVDASISRTRVGSTRTIGAGLGVTFDAEARAAIERSVSGRLDEVAEAFREGQQAMRRAIDIGANTGAPLGDIIEEVMQALDTTFVRASTAVDTAVMGAHRRTLVEQAERAAEATGETIGYLYDGPRDARTRPFCRAHVGDVYTRAALERLDNGQGLPVTDFAGGYACRHRLSPLSLSTAREEGYKVVTT